MFTSKRGIYPRNHGGREPLLAALLTPKFCDTGQSGLRGFYYYNLLDRVALKTLYA